VVGGRIADLSSPGKGELWQLAHAWLDREPWPGGHELSDSLDRVCGATSRGLAVAGSAVTVMADGGHAAVAGCSSPRMRALATLEFDLGEGPCREAFASGRPVLVADLSGVGAGSWPGFAVAAGGLGVGATYAFPLQIGAAALGVLSVYADGPRALDRDEIGLGRVFAEITTEVLINDPAPSPDGSLSSDLTYILDLRPEVFQAQGMVMVALRVSLAEALVRMRAHAFAAGRDLDDLALHIVAGRLEPGAELTS
jgi:hypothetical protein